MLYYLLKRLLFALPVLWLLATLVFILSKLLPGFYGAESILQEGSSSYYAKSSSQHRARVYQEYLHRTGQDLPLFYFSVTSSVDLPDSVIKSIPERERQWVQRLAWETGSWKDAVAYQRTWSLLRQSADSNQSKSVVAYFLQEGLTTDASNRIALATKLQKQMPTSTLALDLLRQTRELQPRSISLQYLLPSFHWHGLANQYQHWLTGILKGDFGSSLRDNAAVTSILLEACSTTFFILLVSMLLTVLLALELSIKLVQPSGMKWRKVLLPVLFVLDSIPAFVLALLLLVLFASPAFLQLFPVYGLGFVATDQNWLAHMADVIPYMILPICCLSLAHLPYLVTQFYSALADAAGMEYTRTARAKGLPDARVIRKHVLRNALLPMITLLSDFLPGLVAGAVVVELIFAIPGMGRLLITSVQARDYPVIVAIVLVVAMLKVLSHVLADLCYAYADPRIRYQTS
ncbi:ABC transporter permease [Pontibacter chitinilyticus]|uniref:ABC transporter permease n=1 Tax=Pontibacter chitinilyticus TaxID=2674989 RepID=UPI0032198250